MTPVPNGRASDRLDRDAVGERCRQRFGDPLSDGGRDAIARLETIAWHAYRDGRKAPRTVGAGPGHADPGHAPSTESGPRVR